MHNFGRSLRRAIRPIWFAALGAAAWAHRDKVRDALSQRIPAVGDRNRPQGATPTKPAAGPEVVIIADPLIIIEPSTSSEPSTTSGEV
jgi:hypothetical protein